MREFKLYLGRTIILECRGEEAGLFDPESKEERYRYIAFGKVDAEGKIIQIAFQPCHAEALVKSLQDDVDFSEEVHIKVQNNKENISKFVGTLHDALLVAANEGAKYDV